jgi:hypothetical protein
MPKSLIIEQMKKSLPGTAKNWHEVCIEIYRKIRGQ